MRECLPCDIIEQALLSGDFIGVNNVGVENKFQLDEFKCLLTKDLHGFHPVTKTLSEERGSTLENVFLKCFFMPFELVCDQAVGIQSTFMFDAVMMKMHTVTSMHTLGMRKCNKLAVQWFFKNFHPFQHPLNSKRKGQKSNSERTRMH